MGSLHDRIGTRYMVDGLQTVEPAALTSAPGIDVVISADLDSMGFHTAEVSGPTREAVLEYVRANWGDDDREWFADYVAARIVEVSANNDAPAEIVARFNVEGFTAREVDALVGELAVQAESSDDHPNAEVIEISAPVLPREGRTILVHVNLTLPPDAPATADDVAREIEAALEIAAEDPSGNAPALQSADLIEIALAEEI